MIHYVSNYTFPTTNSTLHRTASMRLLLAKARTMYELFQPKPPLYSVRYRITERGWMVMDVVE